MPLLHDGIREHWDRLFESAGDLITYTRDTTEIRLQAIKGNSASVLQLPDGINQTTRDDDWIIRANDMWLDGVLEKPKLRDRITWCDLAGATRKYDVGINGVERQWDSLDQHGYLIRIHSTDMANA
jgi:hypothetical protein